MLQVREDGLGWVERPLKVVGQVRPMSPAEALRWNSSMLKLSPMRGRWFPKGAYKFKTWEEEAEWTKMQIRKASLRLK
jgi:hypothetical protein